MEYIKVKVHVSLIAFLLDVKCFIYKHFNYFKKHFMFKRACVMFAFACIFCFILFDCYMVWSWYR